MEWWREYIGRPWAEHTDCFGWFRFWRRRHYGDDVADIMVAGRNEPAVAAKLMRAENVAVAGWRQAAQPVEGDAVFLSKGEKPHHIGMAIFIRGRLHVLHAVESIGEVVVSSTTELLANGWYIKGYWTKCA